MTGYEMLPVTGGPGAPSGPTCGVHYAERRPAKRYRLLGAPPTPDRVGFRLYVATRRSHENWMCDECAQRLSVGYEFKEIA